MRLKRIEPNSAAKMEFVIIFLKRNEEGCEISELVTLRISLSGVAIQATYASLSSFCIAFKTSLARIIAIVILRLNLGKDGFEFTGLRRLFPRHAGKMIFAIRNCQRFALRTYRKLGSIAIQH